MRPSCFAKKTSRSASASSRSAAIWWRSSGCGVSQFLEFLDAPIQFVHHVVVSSTFVNDERSGHGGMKGSGIAKRPAEPASGEADF